MSTSRYVVRDCDGFDEHGDAYVLVPTCEDYYEQLVDLEPCFFGPRESVRLTADGDYEFYGTAPVDLAGTRLTCWHECFLGPDEPFTPPQPLPIEDCEF